MTLTKSTLIYGFALIVERVVSFLTLPILTQSLSADLYGIWTQTTITVSLLTGIVLFNFHIAFINLFSGKSFNEKYRTIQRIILIGLINGGVMIGLLFIFKNPVSFLLFGNPIYHDYVLLLGLLLLNEAVYELITAFLRSAEKITLLAFYYLLRYCGRAFLLFFVLYKGHGDLLLCLKVQICFFFIINCFMYFLHLIVPHFESLKQSTQYTTQWGSFLNIGMPLIPIAVLTWCGNFSDRYWILHSWGSHSLGVYTVSASLSAAIALFYSAIGFTFFPRIASLMNQGEYLKASVAFPQSLSTYLSMAVPAIAGLAVLSEPLCLVFSTIEYVSSWTLMFLLSTSICLFGVYQLFQYLLFVGKKTYLNLVMVFGSTVINLLSNFILIPRVGIIGAAISSVLSNSVLSGVAFLATRSVLQFSIPAHFFIGLFTRTAIMALVLIIIKNNLKVDSFFGVTFCILIGIAVYFFLDILSKNSILRRIRRTQ